MSSIEISRPAVRHRRANIGGDGAGAHGRRSASPATGGSAGDAGRARDVLHDLNARLLERRRLSEEAILDRWLKHVLRRAARLEAGGEGRTSSGGITGPERGQVHA